METKTEQLDGKVKKKIKTAVTAKFQKFQKIPKPLSTISHAVKFLKTVK